MASGVPWSNIFILAALCMTANIYYILRYIHTISYIYGYIYDSTSFPPFVLKGCVGQCFCSPVGQICSQSLSALFWSHWRGRWWLPHGHCTSAGKTTHNRFNKVLHTGSPSLTILSRAPADHKGPGCHSWQQQDLCMWMPVDEPTYTIPQAPAVTEFSLVVLFWQVP